MNQPLVAIVILNYNGKKYLEQFLPFVLSSTYANKKIIIADNASCDDSVSFLRENYPGIESILLEKNYGFAEGYNRALEQVNADYFVLLNSDVEVSPGWIEPIILLLESDKLVAACQPKILSYHQKDLFEYAGAAGGFIDIFGYPFARGRIFEALEKDNHQYDNNREIFWSSGAAMFVRASVYKSLNGLDNYFFAHQEEVDLCWRMQRAGYKIMCCPRSVVYHVGGGTLPKGHRKTFLNFRNNLIMLCKNLSSSEKYSKLMTRIFLDYLFAWKSLFAGDADTFGAVFKAHFAVLKWSFSKRKKDALSKKALKDFKGVYAKSIVWEYL